MQDTAVTATATAWTRSANVPNVRIGWEGNRRSGIALAKLTLSLTVYRTALFLRTARFRHRPLTVSFLPLWLRVGTFYAQVEQSVLSVFAGNTFRQSDSLNQGVFGNVVHSDHIRANNHRKIRHEMLF